MMYFYRKFNQICGTQSQRYHLFLPLAMIHDRLWGTVSGLEYQRAYYTYDATIF